MREQTSKLPPPLPKLDEPPIATVTTHEWHYVANGTRKGPVSIADVHGLLSREEITADTLVWHEGLLNWQALRETDLADLLASQPPPPLPIDGYEQGFKVSPPTEQVRMIDWLQCIKLPLGLIFSPLIVIVALVIFMVLLPNTLSKSQADAIFLSSFALALLGPIAFINQIRGFYFNFEKDRLSFPRYLFRRGVRLSEIHDANCQTITKPAFQVTNTIIGLVSVGQIKGLGTTKRYFVNLSGEFGTRRMVFHTKYKRDQFLSLLRSFAGHVRITRWV